MRCIICALLCYMVWSCEAFRCTVRPHKRAPPGRGINWPSNVVPYELSDVYNADQRKLIVDSLKILANSIDHCIQFVPRTSDHTNWIKVVSKNGCWSSMGMSPQEGEQELSLSVSGCMYQPVIIHEFIHALGFNHEQTRPDRDQHVKIIFENIEPKEVHNFEIDPKSEAQSFGTSYDYASIMHYTFSLFSTNCLPTIVPATDESKKWRYDFGSVQTPTATDIYKIKQMYKCS